jgi:hypothetical protein
MANKQSFTSEEWTKVLESMVLASMAVSAADPNGLWGTIKEAFASKSAIGKTQFASNELVKEVLADFQTSEGRSCVQESLRKQITGATPGDIVQRSLDILREVGAILDAKAPTDSAAFKAWLAGISQQVAEASSEGGFLGVGGVRVSANEKATLSDIAKALGTTT